MLALYKGGVTQIINQAKELTKIKKSVIGFFRISKNTDNKKKSLYKSIKYQYTKDISKSKLNYNYKPRQI